MERTPRKVKIAGWGCISLIVVGCLGVALFLRSVMEPIPTREIVLEPTAEDPIQWVAVPCRPVFIEATQTQLIGIGYFKTLKDQEHFGSGGKYKSSPTCAMNEYDSGGEIQQVVVHGTATGEQRLLFDHRIWFRSLATPDEACAEGTGIAPCGRLVWRLRAEDTNGNGSIDKKDDEVVFLSDLSARNMVQVSPPGYDVMSFSRDARNVLSFQVRRDVDGNGRLDRADSGELWQYDVETGEGPSRVLSHEILDQLQ